MIKLLKSVKYFVIGVLLGSFSFLLTVLFNGSMEVAPKSVLSVFFFSGVIGLISMIFETERWNFPVKLLLHIVMTLFVVCLMMYFGGWWQAVTKHILSYAITIAVTYIGVWLMLYLADVINTQKINAVIRKRKEK